MSLFAGWCRERSYDGAAESLERDWDRMVTFYNFPAEHWKHVRTTNVVLEYGVAAIEPVLVAQSIEDALCCVALLLRRAQVIFEYAVYEACIRLKA